MSTSESNHATAAQNHSGLEESDRHIEAALAIAYEQRTANMIALYTAGGLWRSSVSRTEFGYEIKERLGVAQDD